MSHSGFTGWHNPCLAFASSNPQTETHGRWPRGRRDITQMQADTNSEKLNYKHKYTFWNKYNWLEDTNASRYKFYFNCFPFIDDAGPTAFKYFPQVKIPPRNDSTRKDKQTSGKIEQLKCPKKSSGQTTCSQSLPLKTRLRELHPHDRLISWMQLLFTFKSPRKSFQAFSS